MINFLLLFCAGNLVKPDCRVDPRLRLSVINVRQVFTSTSSGLIFFYSFGNYKQIEPHNMYECSAYLVEWDAYESAKLYQKI